MDDDNANDDDDVILGEPDEGDDDEDDELRSMISSQRHDSDDDSLMNDETFEEGPSEADMSMYLTPDERERALMIKRVVEASENLRPLPDLEYAHLALTCGTSSLSRVVDVVYKLQCFRDMYKLKDTTEDGVETVRQLMALLPGFILDISYLPSENCYTSSCDMAKLFPARVKTQEQWRAFQGGFYYLMRATATNISTIRNGLIILTECEGMGFDNLDVFFQERTVHELWSYYPAKHRESVWLHTPPAANMLHAILKKIISRELMDSWKIGGTLNGYEGRLDTLMNMPTPEIAQQAVLRRLETYLKERYDNEQKFSLTASTTANNNNNNNNNNNTVTTCNNNG